MKKTALTILLATVSAMAVSAQTGYDAWLLSENNYEGTARSVAMGNAFTALGGDLGAVSINPAGSAVAGYSQFSITPSLTISTNIAGGVNPPGSSTLPYFDKTFKNSTTRFGIPNLGFTFHFDTGRTSGLKGWTFGFVLNRSNSWCEDVYAKGINSTTSFAASMADNATATIAEYNANRPLSEPEYTADDFLTDNAYDYMPWRDIVGFRSGIFSSYGTDGKEFIGATEILLPNGNLMQGGPLHQTYGRTVTGNKYEYTFNIGFNISDFIYLGANLGVTSLSYDTTEYFKESPVDTDDFENVFIDGDGAEHRTYFKNMLYRYNYSASGTGIFGKFGIIVTPGYGLRIGAAIQTTTASNIHEQWQENGESEYTDSKFNGSADSPLGSSRYSLNSPFRANVGLAYTIGKMAVISADYEVTDYGRMKFKSSDDEYREYFDLCNEAIKEEYGAAHCFRLGAEVKPLSVLAIRAGYNGTFSNLPKYQGHNVAFGIGYSSKGSFFADAACRYTFATKEYIIPYQEYNNEFVPEILNRYSNWKVLLTLGWRF